MTAPSPAAYGVNGVALWRLERQLLRHYGPVVVVLMAAVLLVQVALWGPRLGRWDWLLVSGALVFVATTRASLLLPVRAHEALRRLQARGAIDAPADVVVALEHGLHTSCRRSALRWSGIVAGLMLAAWIVAFGGDLWPRAGLTLVETLGAAVAGSFIGRAIGYGRMGRRLVAAGLRFQVQPVHPDGAAGLRPVGDLYFFQASLLAVPAAYLAVWWFLIPLVPYDYSHWRDPYLALLAFVIACELFAFAAPMWSFHQIMRERKQDLLLHADGLSRQIDDLHRQLATAEDPDLDRAATHLNRLMERYGAIEAMPTWPISVRVRRRFAVNNALLLLPLFAQLAGAVESWQRFLRG